ncbi:MAG TPA: hypothetical protein VD993_18455 [Chitinophagaceae bacterium]|nr:hypothetical protein [Chitinophagaceae bacterium]
MKSRTVLTLLLALTAIAGNAQVPAFNSHPSAPVTIYLDFDGEYVSGTSWNWAGPINAQAPQLSIAAITEIFERVAEDYRIFNVNITTDSNTYKAAPFDKKTRVIITPTNSWYGNAGGVAFLGSYLWADATPAWVFSNVLGNNAKYIAEACAHEAGHTLGLHHQSTYDANCVKTAEYSPGQGSGEIGWAPIMGVGYHKNLTTWHNGTNAVGCNVMQNDITTIINAGITFRNDEHGDSHKSASNIVLSGLNFTISGIVNQSADKDVFKIVLTHTQNLKLTAIPQNVGIGNAGANVDIRITLLNAKVDTIGRYNPTLLLNAGVDTNLTQGTYYLVAEGIDNANLRDYGSLGYYSLTGALNNALSVQRFKLTGSAGNGIHALNWNYQTADPIQSFEVQSSADGSRFETLVSLQSSERSMFYKYLSDKKIFYRIKALTPDERAYYSNIIALQAGEAGKPVQVMSTLIGARLGINSTGQYQYQLLQQNGQLLQQGVLKAGYNNIPVKDGANGVLLLRVFDGSQYWTEKLIRQ